MNQFLNKAMKLFFQLRLPSVKKMLENPVASQKKLLLSLLSTAKTTDYGKEFHFGKIKTYSEFKDNVPIRSYEELHPYIHRMMCGDTDVLWPGKISWFSKSSGTTNAKSKFIPVSMPSLLNGHYKAGMDMSAWYINQRPESNLYAGYGLSVGGTLAPNHLSADSWIGDISAVIMKNLPSSVSHFRKPSLQIALMDKWEDKIEKLALATMDLPITSIHGVPTWMIVLLKKIVEIKQASSIMEVWPNLELFLHGAVSFTPYRELFADLLPNNNVWYLENYNASEGYFAFQDNFDKKGEMALFTDHGIFYEFIPIDNGFDISKIVPLEEVQLNTNYAMVITTNAGLWRYLIGDTVKFTSTNPFRIKISGRTKQFINAFGEELMVENAEIAISRACHLTGALVADFTAGPIYISNGQKGGHEWLIEFVKEPSDLNLFTDLLDKELKSVNSDYEAKRYQDLALLKPLIHSVPKGTFYQWMKKRGKLGGQNKVPRLSNDRIYLNDILSNMNLLNDGTEVGKGN